MRRRCTAFQPAHCRYHSIQPADSSSPALVRASTSPIRRKGNVANIAGRLFGLDVATALDLAETQGLLHTISEPNLTALSGETASFLAGGEFPIPISEGLGNVSIQYKNYGVSLSFTPTVLGDGRISMRVRPEVSELTAEGVSRAEQFPRCRASPPAEPRRRLNLALARAS